MRKIFSLLIYHVACSGHGRYTAGSTEDLRSRLAAGSQRTLKATDATPSSHRRGRLGGKCAFDALKVFELFILALNPAATAKAAGHLTHTFADTQPWVKLRGGNKAKPMQAGLSKRFSEGLKAQTIQHLQETGASITIMVVGESGLGKTSLISSLFRSDLVWPEVVDGKSTKRIVEQTISFDLDGVPFDARMIDTPGYGDVDASREFKIILRRLNDGFQRLLLDEQRIDRADKTQQPGQRDCTGIDVVLYFFAPHRCKRVDIEFLKLLHDKTSIVPVLAKADSMTSEELAAFRAEVVARLAKAKIGVAHAPVAVISASRPGGEEPLGRRYPWGIAETESTDPKYVHSELHTLRQFLLIDGLLDLKKASRENYEEWRANTLRLQKRKDSVVYRVLPKPEQLLVGALVIPQSRRFLYAALTSQFLQNLFQNVLILINGAIRGSQKSLRKLLPHKAPPPPEPLWKKFLSR